jgi:hypothetical protein
MTRDEAIEIARAEISHVKETNSFTNNELQDVYYSYDQSISEDYNFVLESFVAYLIRINSPLMKALQEVDCD